MKLSLITSTKWSLITLGIACSTVSAYNCWDFVNVGKVCSFVCDEESACEMISMPINETLVTTSLNPKGNKRKAKNYSCLVLYYTENASGDCVIPNDCASSLSGYKENGPCPQSPPA